MLSGGSIFSHSNFRMKSICQSIALSKNCAIYGMCGGVLDCTYNYNIYWMQDILYYANMPTATILVPYDNALTYILMYDIHVIITV